MAQTSLAWEWNRHGNGILIRRKRGRISVYEIVRFMNEERQYNAFAGMLWVILGRVKGPEYLYDGYSDDEDPGDTVEVLLMGDEDLCPVCGELRRAVQYCPDCGRQLWGKEGANA